MFSSRWICYTRSVACRSVHRKHSYESERDSAIYEALEKGPIVSIPVDNPIPREAVVGEIRKLISPIQQSRGYSLIIGEHGTGNTSLVQLAVNSMKEPRGIAYEDVLTRSNQDLIPATVAK